MIGEIVGEKRKILIFTKLFTKGISKMIKRKFMLLLIVIVMFAIVGIIAQAMVGTILNTQEMEAKRGNSWWGDCDTCGYDSSCNECIDFMYYHQESGSSRCTSSTDMKFFDIYSTGDTCDCGAWGVDCGNFLECDDQSCQDGCRNVGGCDGCAEFASGCDEC